MIPKPCFIATKFPDTKSWNLFLFQTFTLSSTVSRLFACSSNRSFQLFQILLPTPTHFFAYASFLIWCIDFIIWIGSSSSSVFSTHFLGRLSLFVWFSKILRFRTIITNLRCGALVFQC